MFLERHRNVNVLLKVVRLQYVVQLAAADIFKLWIPISDHHRAFEYRLFHNNMTTLGKLFTHSCHHAVYFWYWQKGSGVLGLEW